MTSCGYKSPLNAFWEMSARAVAAKASLLRALFPLQAAASASRLAFYSTAAGPGGDGSTYRDDGSDAAGAVAPPAAFTAPRHSNKPALSQKVRFIDRLVVEVAAGKGGGGASSLFGRTGKHPRAAGGHGGKGGDVVLRGTRRLLGLGGTPRHIDGKAGGHGGKQWMEGHVGETTVIDVPLGTLVWELAELEGPATTQAPPTPTTLPRRGAKVPTEGAGPHGVRALRPEEFWWGPERRELQDAARAGQGMEGGVEAGPEPIATAASADPPPPPLAAEAAAAADVPPEAAPTWGVGRRRRRLFERSDLGASAGAAATPAAAPLAAVESSASGGDSSSSRPAGAQPAAAAATISESEEGEGDQLFEQMLSGERPLTANEKRQLWLTGSLEPPPPLWPEEEVGEEEEGFNVPTRRPTRRERRREKRERMAAAAAAEEEEDQEGSSEEEEEKEGSSEEEEEEEEEGEGPVGGWREAWMGLEEEEEPLFSRRQVRTLLESNARLLGELTEDGQTLTIAAGGRGGRGNSTAPSKPYGPASRYRTDGAPGQRRVLLLETRLIADVVLVGLPNVGKSSLMAALTGARAQVGAYAFTTLRPQLGALRFPDGGALTVADVPGLLEGAHAGRGRGAAFLTHLRKARVLALVVDLSGGREGALVGVSPAEQVEVLRSELARFDPALLQLPWLVVANKADCLDNTAAMGALQELKSATPAPILPVSAVQEAGLGRLAATLRVLAGSGTGSSSGGAGD